MILILVVEDDHDLNEAVCRPAVGAGDKYPPAEPAGKPEDPSRAHSLQPQ